MKDKRLKIILIKIKDNTTQNYLDKGGKKCIILGNLIHLTSKN